MLPSSLFGQIKKQFGLLFIPKSGHSGGGLGVGGRERSKEISIYLGRLVGEMTCPKILFSDKIIGYGV